MRAVLKRACLAVLIWLAVQGGCFHRPTIPYISYYPDDPHVGQAVAFDVRFHYANAAATCSWDFGDGATSQDIWVFHTYTASGFYTVTVDGTTTEGVGFHTQEQVQVLNDPPSAYGQVTVTAADTPVDVTLSGSDPESFPLSFVIDVQPGNGTLDETNIPTVTYTPDSGFQGVDSFVFHAGDGENDSATAAVYVGVGNTAPDASAVSDSTAEDTPLPITLPGSDTDGDALVWVIDTQPGDGTLDTSALPDVVYTPDTDFSGVDVFHFHVSDHVDAGPVYSVTVTVTPVNDAPVAEDFELVVAPGTSEALLLLGSDVDGDPLTYEIVQPPSHGTLSGGGAGRAFLADSGYAGPDTFTYRVFDGTVYSNTATVTVRITDGGVYGWGYNNAGQLGDGTLEYRDTPVRTLNLNRVVAIESGSTHCLAVKSDGSVWSWGAGPLGDGTSGPRNAPAQVPGISDIVAVSSSNIHCLALKRDGSVWAWGQNWSGQLGTGTTQPWYSPVQVPGLSDMVAVSAGGSHSLALRSDGTVWSWGDNYYGELGIDSDDRYRYEPAQVAGLSDIAAISAGGSLHSLALKSDGTVWGWGSNAYGQLGTGDVATRVPAPVQTQSIDNVIVVKAGVYFSLALKSDGTVWAWGANVNSQLGDGTTDDRLLPVQVLGLTSIVEIEARAARPMAVKSDGTLWGWGQIVGSASTESVPVEVTLVSGVWSVEVGSNHALVLKY